MKSRKAEEALAQLNRPVGFNPLDNVFDNNKLNSDYSDDIEWEMVSKDRGYISRRTEPMSMYISLKSTHKDAPHKKRLEFRLGTDLVHKLGFEAGDNLLLCYDKNDLCNSMLLKHAQGYKLLAQLDTHKNISFYYITIPGTYLPIAPFKAVLHKYTIDNQKRLRFRVKGE